MNLVNDESQTYDISILNSKNGEERILKVGKFLLHSLYNPLEEATKIATNQYKKNHLHILFGFGMGYIAQELLEKMKDSDRLLIIEPSSEILKIAFENKENALLINDEKVYIHAGNDFQMLGNTLTNYFQNYMGRFTIINSPNYIKLYPTYYKKILESIKENLMLEIVNNNTLHLFSEKWQENFILNLYTAFKANSMINFQQKLICPVIIASGGPSLSKQLPLLKSVKDKALIICAGSTINSLLREGINPHLIVSVDGGDANYRHFEHLDVHHIPLFYPLIVHKGIPNKHEGIQIIFNIKGHNEMNHWSEKLLGKKIGAIQGGPSVANFCLDIANQISSGPICLIGQDLAYTDNQTHAKGNKGLYEINEEKIKERKMFVTEGYYGEEVLTDFVFYDMKKSFEAYISAAKEKRNEFKIYNATEGGVILKGYEQITFKKFIETFCHVDFSNDIQQIFENSSTRTQKEWRKFLKEIKDLIKKHKQIISLTDEALLLLKKVKFNQFMFSNKVLQELNDFDEKLKKLLKNEFMFYILMPVIYSVHHGHLEPENETEEELNKRIYLKSEALYEGIKASLKKGLTWLEELKAKITNIE